MSGIRSEYFMPTSVETLNPFNRGHSASFSQFKNCSCSTPIKCHHMHHMHHSNLAQRSYTFKLHSHSVSLRTATLTSHFDINHVRNQLPLLRRQPLLQALLARSIQFSFVRRRQRDCRYTVGCRSRDCSLRFSWFAHTRQRMVVRRIRCDQSIAALAQQRAFRANSFEALHIALRKQKQNNQCNGLTNQNDTSRISECVRNPCERS